MKLKIAAIIISTLDHYEYFLQSRQALESQNVDVYYRFDIQAKKIKSQLFNEIYAIIRDQYEYLVLCDADDYSMQNRVQISIQSLEDCDIVYGDSLEKNKTNRMQRKNSKPFSPGVRYTNPIIYSSVMVRTSVFDGLSDEIKYGEDWLTWNKLALKGARFKHISKILVTRLTHTSHFLSKVPVYRKFKRLAMTRKARTAIEEFYQTASDKRLYRKLYG